MCPKQLKVSTAVNGHRFAATRVALTRNLDMGRGYYFGSRWGPDLGQYGARRGSQFGHPDTKSGPGGAPFWANRGPGLAQISAIQTPNLVQMIFSLGSILNGDDSRQLPMEVAVERIG